MQTAERVSHLDLSDHYVFQRSLMAYVEAANLVSGKVLEIGTGSGYGIEMIASESEEFITVDKFETSLETVRRKGRKNVEFMQMNVPPLDNIPDNYFDFVVTFQVIEHIKEDSHFVEEIYRVLKNNGKLIVTTPNKRMSLTRNPWHIREYTVTELEELLFEPFQKVDTMGVYGNDLVMKYYEENKRSVESITRFDVFNLQYLLPRFLLKIPYDVLNRMNRRKLLKNNRSLTSGISVKDYSIKPAKDDCLDLFYIAEKKL